MILYFYRWKNEYVECALRSGTIAVPYDFLFGYGKQAENMMAEYHPVFQKLRRDGVKVYAVLPAVSAGYHHEQLRHLSGQTAKLSQWIDGFYIGNQGQWKLLRNWDGLIFGDVGLNVFNTATAEVWKSRGLSGVTFSYELELADIATPLPFNGGEILLYGRVPVMISEYCPVAGAKGIDKDDCGACGNNDSIRFGGYGKKEDNYPFFLESKRGERYPLLLDRHSCRSTILSAASLDRRQQGKQFLKDCMKHSPPTRWPRIRLCIFDESPEWVLGMLLDLTP